MNLEELNKTQIILLTLLTSFVTSIATGIVTVSLMAQAPQGITQTINRIVERTVEKVVPDTGRTQTITEKTVIVKDDDVAADSIGKVQAAVIRIVAKDSADSAFYARGVVIDSGAAIAVTSKGVLDPATPSEVLLSNGVRVPFTVRKSDSESVAVLELDMKNATTTKLSSIPFADLGKARLGQSVYLLSGKGRDAISQGIIAGLPTEKMPYIEATAVGSLPGAIIVNIFGDIVGMVTVESVGIDAGLYTPANSIADALKKPSTNTKAP